MMVSGELYSQDMNSLVHQYDSLHFQQHWPLNHQPLHSLIKKEPSDESDYFKKDKVLPLTPPGYMTDYQRTSEYDSSEYSNGVDYGDDRTSSDERECPDKVRTPPLSSLTPAVTLTEGMTPPGSSPDTTGALGEHASPDKHEQIFENGDSLKKLQMALQRNGLIYEEKLQCPMCDFNCSVRSSFNEHLLWHETKCSACEFIGDTRDALKEHMRAAHDVMSDDDHWPDDEPGLTTPKVNSQGKVKTFKCKQCEFSAVTKAEFWDHSKVHIKRDRILTCPKCPFITEYKHHLEYHLRNHFGSKPFKCDKCSYTCVNKSMLNSHLKSHSNVYQFRCADCTYATKYCHSLKLHLRKYGHGPAMVLNPDGSPNPLPIVDVYGTRRGPKQKGSGGPNNNNNNNNNNNTVSESQQTSPSVPVFNPYSFIPTQLPYYSLLNSIPPFPFTPDQNEEKNNNLEKATGTEDDEEEPFEDKAPLDLTCPEPTNDSDNTQNNFDNPETPVTKNRRKGKAYKIEKVALRLTNEGEDDDEPEPKRLREEELVDLSRTAKSPEVNLCEADSEQKALEIKDDYNCTYCDISFKDIVMYTMHMGYHGYQDPFTCNMCGQQTSDKVSFFLHIARTSHS